MNLPTPLTLTHSPLKQSLKQFSADERGGSRLNFLITVFLLVIAGYAAAQYVPVAWHAELFQDAMQRKVDQAAALGNGSDWVVKQLRAEMLDFDIPPDATITAQERDKRIETKVSFTHPIALPGYIYEYRFDHTARSGSTLLR